MSASLQKIKISILILNYNGKDTLRNCLDSLAANKSPDVEFIVIDNASTDGSIGFVECQYPWVHLVKNKTNCGYALGNNIGSKIAKGQYLIFINNDTIVCDSKWIATLYETIMKNEKIGIIGPKLLKLNLRIDSVGGDITYPLGFAPPIMDNTVLQHPEEVAYVSGAALMIRSDLFSKLEGFDPSFFAFHEEVDLCWRARAKGYTVVCEPNSSLIHIGSVTYGAFSPLKEYLKERNRLITNMKNYDQKSIIDWASSELIYAFLLSLGSLISRKARRAMPYYFFALSWFISNFRWVMMKREANRIDWDENNSEALSTHRRENVVKTIIFAYLREARHQSMNHNYDDSHEIGTFGGPLDA